jgi:subtilisin family serine protease
MSAKKTNLKMALAAILGWSGCTVAATDIPMEIPEELLEEARSSYIFVFDDGVGTSEVRGLAKRLAVESGGELRHVFAKAIKGFSASLPEEAAARIGANPRVAYYEPNLVFWAQDRVPTHPGTPSDGTEFLGNGPGRGEVGDSDQVVPWGVVRVGGPRDGSGRHAWIIDSGIDLDHPDLNLGFGANFVTIGRENSPQDTHGHGTHVAGTVAALDNEIDVIGVAPNAVVHPVRVLSQSGFGMTDWIVAGIDYVAANALPGDCANMSLGGPGHQESMHQAVVGAAALGVRFALAAGNESDFAGDYEPAHIDGENIYTVSAVDGNDAFAYFSNWGNPPVDLAAPGVAIVSTRLDGGVTTMSGTSMAAPHVCGLLLFGAPGSDGTAIDDPDGDPDPIAHFPAAP